jgi:hypothetical protein
MRIARLPLLAIGLCFLTACANLYRATSSNPALIEGPNVRRGANVAGVADLFGLVAVDGQAMGTPTVDSGFWRIDPGRRSLTLAYEGNERASGPKFTGSPIVLSARLEAGHRYRVICESADLSVKVYVRDLGTSRIVSNVAETTLFLQPAPAVPPPLAIPARRH